MDTPVVIAILSALVALSTVIAIVVRAGKGRVRAVSNDHADAQLTVRGADLTLVQLSGAVCSACGPMRRVAEQIVAESPLLARLEFDVAEHAELAREHRVLSTPTTLLVDSQGIVRSRITGAATPAGLRDAVEAALRLSTPSSARSTHERLSS